MSTGIFRVTAAAAALLAYAAAAHATTLNGTYTAIDANPGPYAPTINDDGGSFLPSPFSGNLAVGQTTTPTVFLQVAPIGGSASVGTISGAIDIAMSITDGSAITAVSASSGGNGAFSANGTIYFNANYQLFYGNQTDCLSWNSVTCTPNDNTTTIGETLKVSFADNAVLDINLYNWSDWNMSPDISFELVSGPNVTVPEPASFAVFGTALIGLCLARRRRQSGPDDNSLPLAA